MRSFIILSVCFFANLSIAATCTSLSSGNWTDPATWSCGVQPSAGDTIMINVGDTVTISENTDLMGIPVVIVINGVLLFDSPSAKLKLECGSSIVISATGSIEDSGNGTSSHSIKICGIKVWQGDDGRLTGPIILGSIPLPIELINLKASKNVAKMIIEWSTLSEINNDYFVILGSIDGNDWRNIGVIDGAGTSDDEINYEIEIQNARNYQFIKLVQYDFDGNSSESKSIAVVDKSGIEVSIYPNPLIGNKLNVDLIEFNNASIRIFNLKGNLVYESHNIRSSHLEILDFNFENGVYIIEIQNGNKIEHFKLLKAS